MQKTEEEINRMMGEYWMLLNNDLDQFNLIQKVLDESPQTMESVNLLISVKLIKTDEYSLMSVVSWLCYGSYIDLPRTNSIK